METRLLLTLIKSCHINFLVCIIIFSSSGIADASGLRFFASCSSQSPYYFTKGNLFSGSHTLFGPGESTYFSAMEFNDHGDLYCISTGMNPQLKKLDTASGILTTVGPLEGQYARYALSFSTLTNKMYMFAEPPFAGDVQIFTLNLHNARATRVSSIHYYLTDIAINSNGECYASNGYSLVKINLENGLSTFIGFISTTGLAVNALCFDRATDILYSSYYNSILQRYEIRIIDTSTAQGTLVSVLNPPVGNIIGFAMPFDNESAKIILNLSMFIEGFYNDNSQTSDSLRVYLRQQSSPFQIVDQAEAIVSTTGDAVFQFSNAQDGNYYIAMTHRNSIETWSANSVSMSTGNFINYNFTSSITQAFGNNMKQVDSSPIRFAIFSGDVNQDGTVDLTDIVSVFNDANAFLSGYVTTDVTGDDFVDLSDLTLTFNNANNFVGVIRP